MAGRIISHRLFFRPAASSRRAEASRHRQSQRRFVWFQRRTCGVTPNRAGVLRSSLGSWESDGGDPTENADPAPPASREADTDALLDDLEGAECEFKEERPPAGPFAGAETEDESSSFISESAIHQKVITPGRPRKIRFLIGRNWRSVEQTQQAARTRGPPAFAEEDSEETETEAGGESERDDRDDRNSYSLKSALESLLGYGLLHRRYRPNYPQTSELLRHLRANFNLAQWRLNLYERPHPSLLGTSSEWAEQRAAWLRSVGFTEQEVSLLLSIFPPMLEVDLTGVFAVHAAMKKFSFTSNSICGLLQRHPHIFLLDAAKVTLVYNYTYTRDFTALFISLSQV